MFVTVGIQICGQHAGCCEEMTIALPGAHAGETDRSYSGGMIVNDKVPKTGDPAKLSLWTLCILPGLAAVSTVIYTGRRRK